MKEKSLFPIFTILILSSCASVKDRLGEINIPTVFESALTRACNAKAPDIIPNTPFISQGFLDNSGNGSAASAITRFLEGFETIENPITADTLTISSSLSVNDPSIWGLRPLVNQIGIANLGVVERPHPGCDDFEAVVKTQGEPDAARFFTFSSFAPNPPRNWCINAFAYENSAMEFTYDASQSAIKDGNGSLNQKIETLKRGNEIIARRTQIWLVRPQFPIGVVNINTDCEGRIITTPAPEFVGKNGIALRPKREPNLVAVN